MPCCFEMMHRPEYVRRNHCAHKCMQTQAIPYPHTHIHTHKIHTCMYSWAWWCLYIHVSVIILTRVCTHEHNEAYMRMYTWAQSCHTWAQSCSNTMSTHKRDHVNICIWTPSKTRPHVHSHMSVIKLKLRRVCWHKRDHTHEGCI
jgi:hypothetical protein